VLAQRSLITSLMYEAGDEAPLSPSMAGLRLSSIRRKLTAIGFYEQTETAALMLGDRGPGW
jgi:hypothetical protein